MHKNHILLRCALSLLLPIFAFASTTVSPQNSTEKLSSDTKPEKILTLYHDADWSNHVESAQSIFRGVETALSEVNHQVQGYRLKIVKKDHSGNVALSRNNISEFIIDENALAIISGIHSAPLIRHRDFINENKAPTLVPWAAGGPITRYPSKENWVFRLSIDDTKAGDVLVDFALNNKNCKRPNLLLENTPWGDSNLKSMSLALDQRDKTYFRVTRFSWGLKSYVALNNLQTIIAEGSDCILLVANALEGAEIAHAMANIPAKQRIPIISHWGITGGQFHETVAHNTRQEIDLSFIQSCFSFMQAPLSNKGHVVFKKAKERFPESIQKPIDIRSPVGFIHAYDLTLLLIAALKQVALSDDIAQNRFQLRKALENLKQPISGLVKTYQQPFTVYTDDNKDAHEALSSNEYCMATYGASNEINLLDSK